MARYDRRVELPAAAARTLIRRIVDDGILGVAVLDGAQHIHLVASPEYERLVGAAVPLLGRPLRDALDSSIVSEVFLAGVLEGGRAAVHEVERNRSIVTFRFCRVDGTASSILVIAEDVTSLVGERERAKLFTALTAELLPAVDPRSAVRSVVKRSEQALGARSSSVFIIDEAGLALRGAVGEWDWTRTSFEVPLVDWPNVADALATGGARFITKAAASGAEAGWFEARGIAATLCVPLRANGGAVGVLFFDFDTTRRLPIASLDFADAIGAQCAAALARASGEERAVRTKSKHVVRRLHRARASARSPASARAHNQH